MSEAERPDAIVGGCLCGAIRYKITFTNQSWPPYCSSCQCSKCRKWTGALHAIAIMVPLAQLSLPSHDSSDPSQLRQYTSSENCIRQFCGTCGSSLTFRHMIIMADSLEVWVGTLDEEVLIGKLKGDDDTQKLKKGEEHERDGGWGQAILRIQDNLFWGSRVKGLTDGPELKGARKWWGMIQSGKPFV